MPEGARPDLAALMQRVQGLRSGMQDVRGEMLASRVTGHGGGGLVTATVTGNGELVDLRVDPSLIDPDDPGTLVRHILEAAQRAHTAAAARGAERFAEVTDEAGDLLAGFRQRLAAAVPQPPPDVPPLVPPPGAPLPRPAARPAPRREG